VRSGDAFVGLSSNGDLFRIKPGATKGELVQAGGAVGRQGAFGMKVDGSGRLWVAGGPNGTLAVVDPAKASTLAVCGYLTPSAGRISLTSCLPLRASVMKLSRSRSPLASILTSISTPGFCAAETDNPRKTLPTAVKQVFWRICLFYMVSLNIVGCLVPYDDPELIGSSSSDANASPFVIAVKNAGIKVVPSIMNVVIMIAVLSVGNSSIYGSSRTLAALADRGQAPKFLGYIDRSGRPLMAILFSSAFGFICYIVAAGTDTRTQAFNWMLAISGLAAIFNWASICLCHIRFRAAWKYHGHTLDELAFKSQATVWGSWVGLIFNILILIAQFWTGFAPVGYGEMTAGERVENFFMAYLAFPIVVLMYIIYKLIYKTKFKSVKDMDITSGRREMDLAALLAEERAIQAQWPRWKKIYKTVC